MCVCVSVQSDLVSVCSVLYCKFRKTKLDRVDIRCDIIPFFISSFFLSVLIHILVELHTLIIGLDNCAGLTVSGSRCPCPCASHFADGLKTDAVRDLCT